MTKSANDKRVDPGTTLRPSSLPPVLRFQRPWLPPAAEIERYFERSRTERRFSNGGPCWQLLRDRLAERVGAHCVPVASATAGLMAAAGVLCERGREVLLPSFTFPATVQAALWAGLRPRLLDVSLEHWHLEPIELQRELTAQTGLVLAVSAFGTPPPPEVRTRWESICREAGVPLLVDSAAGFGARAADGLPIGRQGDVEVVSFHATKPFAIGEGGAVFTGDQVLRERIEAAINFGFGDQRAPGLNAKMSEVHAATGCAVLDHFDAIVERRRAHAAALRGLAAPGITFQAGAECSTWQFMPTAFARPEQRSAALRRLNGTVETRIYYEPIHLQERFAGLPRAASGCANSELLWQRLLCLPMANDLTEDEIQLIARGIRED